MQGGGDSALAPLMAAIALAESGGQTNALNPSDNGGKQSSFGLWQISTGTHTPPDPNWSDPVVNARLAVGKYKSQGLKAWGTYTSGAYKRFLANGVPATPYTSGGTQGQISEVGDSGTGNDNTCAWNVSLPVAGNSCILSKTMVRNLLGGIVIAGGVVVILTGTVLLLAYGLKKPVSTFVPKVGGKIGQPDPSGNR